MVDLELFRQAIKDAFEPWDLFDYMEITMDEFLDAFPDKWETNKDLITALDFDDRDVTEDRDELDDWLDTREVEDDGGYY